MEHISQIVTDSLTWETIKYIVKAAAGAIAMSWAGQYLLKKVFNRLKKPPEVNAYWIGMPILLFVFLVAISSMGNRADSDLRGQIEVLYLNHIEGNASVIVAVITLTNSGLMPSVAVGWQMSILHNNQTTECIPVNTSEKIEFTVPSQGSFPQRKVTYFAKDLIAARGLSPIPPGGLITGILYCELRNVDAKIFQSGDQFTASFLDVLLHKHTLSIRGTGQLVDVRYYPGITQEIK